MREAEVNHGQPKYFIVFAILALFTAMEVGITFLPDLPDGIKIAVLIFLAATKVALVVMYFMHLKFDSRTFMLPFALGVVIAIPLILTLTLSPPESSDDEESAGVRDVPGQTEEAGEAEGTDMMSLGDQVFQNECAQCHEHDRIRNTEYDREAWTEVVDRMISYGCPIDDQEREAIIEFLTAGGAQLAS